MRPTENEIGNDGEGVVYDQQVQQAESYAHDVLFGLSFEFIKPNDLLLDIGIGTGLCSLPFANQGLVVHGIDYSESMLKACKLKSFAHDLQLHDIRNIPWPYPERFYDHVISCGVLHFIGDLESLFKEVSRIIKLKGYFVFTVIAAISTEKGKIPQPQQEEYSEHLVSDVKVYTHNSTNVQQKLAMYDFHKLKEIRFLGRSEPGKDENLLYSAFVVQQGPR